MSDLRGFNQNLTPGRNSGWGAIRRTADGALYIAEHVRALSIEGRIFGAHFGTLTTPLATAATTAITTLRPMAWLRVPDGTAIIPLTVNLLVESAGATTQGEALLGIATSDVGNGTSSAGTSGALGVSLNSAAPISSTVIPRQLATADVSADYALELKRFSFAASAVNQDFSWQAAQELVPSVLRGAATLMLYIGGNAVNFYCQMQWIELPESAVS